MTGKSVKEQLFHFVDDLERSLDFKLDEEFDCDAILLCGVGGSAVSGDFVADCCCMESPKYLRLMKYPDLPKWVGSRTLVIVSSYSGNTAETMQMYRQARERGCKVIAVTSGGILKSEADVNGDRVILLPCDMHPRHAIGYMIGYTLAVVRAAGGPDLSDRVKAFIPALREYRDLCALAKDSLAYRLAKEYTNHVPVICADIGMQSVAFRWKTQINENSKFVAFCESMPDFSNHNLSQWVESSRDNYALTFLVGADDGLCRGTERLKSSAKMLTEHGRSVHVVHLGADTTLENMFRAIILGDYVSMYMAENRGIDPAEVRPVTQLKEKLARFNRC